MFRNPLPPSFRRRRCWLLAAAGVILVTGVVLVATPYAIRWQALKWLRQHGHESAQITDVDFNPFSGRLSVLALGGGTGEGAELALDQIAVQVDWIPLFGHRVMVKDVALENVTIDVRRETDGTLVVGRIAFPPSSEEADTTDEPDRPWLLGLGNLDLRNVTVRYSDSLVDTVLLVRELHIDPALQWAPQQATAFRAELELDGEQWSLGGTAQPFADNPSVDVRIQLKGLVQRRYPRLLGQLGIEDLTLQAHTKARLQANYDRESGQFEISHQSELRLRQVQFSSQRASGWLDSLDWDGTITVTGSAAEPRIAVDGTLEITGYGADLAAAGGAVGGESLRWAGPVQIRIQPGRTDLELSGALELTGLSAAQPSVGLRAAHLEAFDLEVDSLQLALSTEPPELGITAQTTAVLQQVAVDHEQGSGKIGGLTWEGAVEFSSAAGDEPGNLEANGVLHLTELAGMHAAVPTGKVADATLSWEGEVRLRTGDHTELDTAGTLVVAGLEAGLASPPLDLRQPRVRWKGEVSFRQPAADAPPEIGISGDLDLENTVVTNRDNGLSLLELDSLALDGVVVGAPRRIAVAEIRLDGLRMVQNASTVKAEGVEPGAGNHVLSLAELRVERLAAEGEERMAVGAIRLAGLQARVIRGEDGQFGFQKSLPVFASSTGNQRTPEQPESGAEAPPLVVSLGQAHVEGDNRLAYLDNSVDPPYQFEITPFEIHLGEVDSSDPEAMSPLSLRARTGRYATIEVDGKVGLFATRPTLSLTGKVAGVNLAPATALAQRYTGYRIRSGLLDADLRVDIDQGMLDSETTLTANKLEMVKLDPKNLDELDQQLGLPLNAALDLLRDSDDSIHLVIPVAGDLSDPDIDISHAVRTALMAGMTKAISTGALTYLVAIGSAVVLPVGAAVAAGKVVSLATALRFAPVPFSAGEGELSAPAREQLDQLASLLTERPKIRLTLCGFAASPDELVLQGAALRQLQHQPPEPPPVPHAPVDPVVSPEAVPEQDLLDLALSRGDAVKAHLVESRGIDPGRLLVCSPEIDVTDTGEPRVEVSL